MNIINGSLDGTIFQAEGAKIPVNVGGRLPSAVLGVRPEDCAVTRQAKSLIKGETYATELIGDHTLVTVKAAGGTLTVKAPKDFTANVGEIVGITLDKNRLFVFNGESGARVR
jgi:multiple sugar transport system ATP-binding protein